MTDLIIVGAGPAGLTAAIYALRAKKSVLVIEQGALGGQMTFSPKIENYPGFTELSGNMLADKMVEQALGLGAEIELDRVTGVRDDGDVKTVVTENGEYACRAVILAVGAAHRKLGLPNEDCFIGSGISFCAVCDAAFFDGQTVAVIGGGNSAMQEALLLSDTCKRVVMVQNLPNLTGEPALQEKIAARDNIELICSAVAVGILGDETFAGVEIEHTDTGVREKLAADGMFIAIGLDPQTAPFRDLAAPDQWGYFDVDESCAAGVPGVFVAGDCRRKQIRQITTAAADGAVAAMAACRYLD